MNRLLTLPDPLILKQTWFLQICTLLYFESYLIKLSFIAIFPQTNGRTNNVIVKCDRGIVEGVALNAAYLRKPDLSSQSRKKSQYTCHIKGTRHGTIISNKGLVMCTS